MIQTILQRSRSEGPFRHPVTSSGEANVQLRFLHGQKAEISGAFLTSEKKTVVLRFPRSAAVVSVIALFFKEDGTPIENHVMTFSGLRTDGKEEYSLSLPDRFRQCGLYFVRFSVKTAFDTYFLAGGSGNAVLSKNNFRDFQILVSAEKIESPKKPDVIYQIFVDRFARAEKITLPAKKGTKSVENWNTEIPEYPAFPGAPLKNDFFYGGNLYGIAEKLDYLSSLGVTMIYLSPIFESPSNHKYDTSDYEKIDDAFGGEEGLRTLLYVAKKRGISLILDGVFNHTGADSKYFNKYGNYGKGGAYQDKKSPYYCWYEFGHDRDRYTCWWDVPILPRIKTGCAPFERYIAGDGGIVERYAEMGIGGMRLDVADELSDRFLSRIRAALERKNPNAELFGEVWEDASNKIAYGQRKQYYLGGELTGVMNYPLRTGLIDYLREGKTEMLRYALTEVMANAPKPIRDRQMNLLGTHDTVRILTALAGESPEGKANSELIALRMSDKERKRGVDLLKLAYAILATLPGRPMIYYGDEAGMEGYADPFNRRTFPWGSENEELLDTYRTLGKIRKSCVVFADGDFELIALDRDKMIYTRGDGTEKVLIALNLSSAELVLKTSDPSRSLVTKGKKKTHALPAFSFDVIDLCSNENIEIIR